MKFLDLQRKLKKLGLSIFTTNDVVKITGQEKSTVNVLRNIPNKIKILPNQRLISLSFRKGTDKITDKPIRCKTPNRIYPDPISI